MASVRITSAPASLQAGEPFDVTVELLGPDGTLAANATDEVTLALADDEVAINGTTSVSSDGGVATFTNLTITTAGTNHQLIAGSGGVSAGSGTFGVIPGPPAAGQSSVSPPPGNVPPNGETSLTFSFKDAFGNATPGLPIAISSSLAGATLLPSAGTTSVTGTFETLLIPANPGSATLTATVGGVPITIASPFVSVELCPAPVAMAFPGSVIGTQPCGAYVSTSIAPSLFSFASPGGGAAFTITPTFEALFQALVSPDQDAVTFFADANTPTTIEYVLQPGPYVFGVATASGPGSFVLLGAAGAGNSPGVARALVTHGVYSGQSLSVGDFQFGDQSYFDVYFFFSTAACKITLSSAAFGRYLIVVDAITGVSLDRDRISDVSDVVSSLGSCRGGQHNPIAIIVNSMEGNQVGPYTLRVEPVPPPPGAALIARDRLSRTLKPTPLNAHQVVRNLRGLKPGSGR